MKAKFLLIATLLNGAIFACNDHLFHLALNQRSYYNPAALCPYCAGSPFFSAGISFIPGSNNGFGNNYAFGNDGPNLVHGPWDFAYSSSHVSGMKTNAFGFRYAFEQDLGKWKVAAGFRESFYSIHQTISVEGVSSEKLKAKLWDTDAGAMITNQKGFYAGISVLHFTSPQKIFTNENGTKFSLGTQISYCAMGGYVQKLNKKWDLLPDISCMSNKTEAVAETGMMIRYKHHFAGGGGMVFSNQENASYEIRGGYMSSTFKWLFSAAPSSAGWNVETGIVLRIQSGPCDGTGKGRGGSCNAGGSPIVKRHVKPQPVKDNDDFVRHR